MKKFIVNTSLILALFSAVYFGNHYIQSYLGSQAKQDIPFPIHTLSDGLETAAVNEQLVLVEYSAVWCPSCRKLNQKVFADAGVAEVISDNFSFVSIDHDSEEGKAFAEKFKLVGFPRVLVFSHSGEKLMELPLSFEPRQYQANLQKLMQAYPQS